MKSNNFNKESFCPEVYNQLGIDHQGDLKICSISSDGGLAVDESGMAMNVKTHSIVDALNSPTHKRHRIELSNNIKPERCSNCFSWESRSPTSRRLKFISLSQQKLDYVKVNQAADVTMEDGSIDVTQTKLVNLDIKFGNLCNLKCIMCDPGHSSLWYEDWEMLSRAFPKTRSNGRSVQFGLGGVDPVTGNTQFWKDKNNFYLLEKNKHGKVKLQSHENWWETEAWKTQFRAIAGQLQYLYFTGGEPLLVPSMEEHMDYLIEQGFAKNIMLCYDTNLIAINQSIIDKWKFFKDVDLRVSVDDTGDRYNVVRNPGKFERLYENIVRIQQANIKIRHVSIVCSLVNIYGVIRVAQLAKELGVGMSLRFVTRPGWINVLNLPRSAKEEIISTLTEFLASDKSETVKGYESFILQEIKHFQNNLDTTSASRVSTEPSALDSSQMLQTFVQVMDLLDQSRNIDWKHTLPDLVELLKKHCPELPL